MVHLQVHSRLSPLSAATIWDMNSRPKATDTQDDLLAMQSSFFSSGERPSVSVKRKVQDPSAGSSVGAKDVVRLSDEGT